MAKQEVTQVKIVASNLNSYSQLMRACLSGMNACVKVNNPEFYNRLADIFDYASLEHSKLSVSSFKEDAC